MIRPSARLLATLGAAGLLVLLGAAPAYADAAKPSNYVSTVTGLDPQLDGVTVEVAGGDAFLVVTVDRGHRLAVPGYSKEPYVRIDADGTVWVNRLSPTLYINAERYGRVVIPATADAHADAVWDLVGRDGTYAWHDHRTHWMSFDRPPGVGASGRQVVFPWSIPIEVDGTEVMVSGVLEWLPTRSALLPALIGLAALLPLAVSKRRRIAAAALVAAAGAIGSALTIAEAGATPASARSVPALVVFPAVAFVSGLTAMILRGRPQAALWALLVGSLTIVAWAFSTVDVLWLPVLISSVPDALERILVAVVAWTGIGGLAVWAVAFRERLRAREQREVPVA